MNKTIGWAPLESWLDHAVCLAVVLDRGGRVVYASHALTDFLGWGPRELRGRDWFETCLPERLRSPVRSAFRLLVAGDAEPVATYTNPVLTRDRVERVVAWHNSTVFVEGEVVGTFSVGTPTDPATTPGPPTPDSTPSERRAELYRDLFDTSPVGYCVLDARGDIRMTNQRLTDMVGLTAESLIGRELVELVADIQGGHAVAESILAQIGRGEAVTEVALPLHTAAGGVLWTRMTADPFDVEDELQGIRAAFVDVSEVREQAERARLYAALVEAMPAGAVVLERSDEGLRLTAHNTAAERICGLPLSERLGRGLQAAFEGHGLAFAESAMATSEHVALGDFRSSDGERLARVDAFPLPGGRAGLVIDDITELRSAADALQQRAAELARSNADLEQFAYVASHDLQEPLRKVESYAQLLSEDFAGGLGDEGAGYVGRIFESARRMRTLIDDLLALSGVRGRGGDIGQRVDLGHLMGAVAGELDARIRECGAEVQYEGLPVITGDPGQLRQLLTNLVQNALKFRRPTVAPEVLVSAELRVSSDGATLCSLTVTDNGVGFDPTQSRDMFAPFGRLHGRAYEGTGIGLAICSRIAERHGGRITATGRPGAGAAFTVSLPVHAVGATS